jgi:hypothetical protein
MFSSGIGTLWNTKGVTSSPSVPCAYTGTNANLRYKEIRGTCKSFVPLEQSTGNAASDCNYWSELCLKDELMTPSVTNKNYISNITVGSLEDLGYEVNYEFADEFFATNLGTKKECQCKRRSLLDGHHRNETRQFGLGHPDTTRRVQSTDAYQRAIDFGQTILAANELPYNVPRVDGGLIYMADQAVSVVVSDGYDVISVVVRPQT